MNFRTLLVLVNYLLLCCILLFSYLLLEGKVDEFFVRPAVQQTQRPFVSSAKKESIPYNGRIDFETGLVYAEGFREVKANCTICHSAKLITQNSATRDGWAEMIDWMQRTQGLWELGEFEPVILDYLALHYAPKESGRRAELDTEAIEWYVLELEEKK